MRRLLKDQQGQDLIEYGLLAALVSVAAIAAVLALGNSIKDLYDTKVVPLW